MNMTGCHIQEGLNMPKDLFFTISERKRGKIFDSALEEFSKQLFFESSINQIIKNADISRGSFYQYFDDKEDLYFYIISDILNNKVQSFSKQSSLGSNNIFSIFKEIFVLYLEMISHEKYNTFFKMFFLNMNHSFQKRLDCIISETSFSLNTSELDELLEKFEGKKQYLEELKKMIILSDTDLIIMKIVNNMDDEQIMKIHDTRMELLSGKVQF